MLGTMGRAIEPGMTVGGDFRVVSPLGEGGMGALFVAEQISVGRRRALKVMHRELLGDGRLRERFIQEAKVGATIDSEHVVEVVAAGFDEELGVPWLAMELLEGSDLATAIATRGPLSLSELDDVLEQLCHALAAAHRVGVVHRDLKPENVFLSRSRRSRGSSMVVRVLDFGIAKVVAEARETGASTAALGTPLFMAPEQTELTTTITPAADVWALGLIAFHALTGRHFWRACAGAPSMSAILREVLVDRVPAASSRAAELGGETTRIPPGFDDWFQRCVARDPAARFTDAAVAYESFAAFAADSVKVSLAPTEPPAAPTESDDAVAVRRAPTPAAPTPTPTPHRLAASPITPAPIIQGFELEERVGRGPRSDVWRAKTRSGAVVALKILHAHLTRGAGFATVFEKETAPLLSMSHPNILGAIDRGCSNGHFFVVMEWMSAGSLRSAIAKGPLPLDRTIRIARGVCDALEYAHRRACPHRNLVAENVFVDASERVRVGDLGLSLLTAPRHPIAPGDARSDLKAVGELIRELVSGGPGRTGKPSLPPRVEELLERASSPGFDRAGELSLALRLATPRTDEGEPVRTAGPADAAVVSTSHRVVSVTLAEATRVDTLRSSLDGALRQPGRWCVGYDIRAPRLDEPVALCLREVHEKHRDALVCVAFCSKHALARARALVLGGPLDRTPSKIFATPQAMQRWIEEQRNRA
jgi:serine/threonine protein kinase